MSSLVIWIEKNEAKIFQLNPNQILKTKIRNNGNHPRAESNVDEERFFADLSKKLKTLGSDEWYIIGPGVAKDHFMHYLEKHSPALTDYIRGIEKKDVMTDNQIVQEGARFFRKAHVFNTL